MLRGTWWPKTTEGTCLFSRLLQWSNRRHHINRCVPKETIIDTIRCGVWYLVEATRWCRKTGWAYNCFRFRSVLFKSITCVNQIAYIHTLPLPFSFFFRWTSQRTTRVPIYQISIHPNNRRNQRHLRIPRWTQGSISCQLPVFNARDVRIHYVDPINL